MLCSVILLLCENKQMESVLLIHNDIQKKFNKVPHVAEPQGLSRKTLRVYYQRYTCITKRFGPSAFASGEKDPPALFFSLQLELTSKCKVHSMC